MKLASYNSNCIGCSAIYLHQLICTLLGPTAALQGADSRLTPPLGGPKVLKAARWQANAFFSLERERRAQELASWLRCMCTAAPGAAWRCVAPAACSLSCGTRYPLKSTWHYSHRICSMLFKLWHQVSAQKHLALQL